MLKFKGKKVDIKSIKKMTYEELSELCYIIRNDIIKHVSSNGGHLSSNLGVVELEVALARFFDFPRDKLLIDVGHQSYTYKMITGRDLSTLRKKGGVAGFQKRDESPYDVFEAGHSSTSLSGALGMAIARDIKKEKYEIISLIGDASIMNGMALEALNDIGQRKNKVIIILNDNNMSVSKTVGALHDNSKVYKDFNLEYVGPIDGHNFEEIEHALQIASESKKSILIHAYTEKGKGYPYAEYDTMGIYHGISPFKIRTGTPIGNNDGKITYPSYFGKLVLDAMSNNQNLVTICPAMVLGSGLQNVFLKFPHRCFDVGIAEEHALTLASGIALNGLKPIVSIYSTFLQRAFDQVSHDIARMNLNALLLIDRSGLVGEDGDTHQGLYDEAFLLNTPNITVTVPSDILTSKALFELGLKHNGPFAIRYSKNYMDSLNVNKDYSLEYGKWLKVMDGNLDIAIITVGDIINHLKIRLKEENISCSLYNALFLNPMDEVMLKEIMTYKNVVIINPMATENGFNNKVISYLIKNDYKGNIKSLAVKSKFIQQATVKEQLFESGLDDETIINTIKELL